VLVCVCLFSSGLEVSCVCRCRAQGSCWLVHLHSGGVGACPDHLCWVLVYSATSANCARQLSCRILGACPDHLCWVLVYSATSANCARQSACSTQGWPYCCCVVLPPNLLAGQTPLECLRPWPKLPSSACGLRILGLGGCGLRVLGLGGCGLRVLGLGGCGLRVLGLGGCGLRVPGLGGPSTFCHLAPPWCSGSPARRLDQPLLCPRPGFSHLLITKTRAVLIVQVEFRFFVDPWWVEGQGFDSHHDPGQHVVACCLRHVGALLQLRVVFIITAGVVAVAIADVWVVDPQLPQGVCGRISQGGGDPPPHIRGAAWWGLSGAGEEAGKDGWVSALWQLCQVVDWVPGH